MAGGTVGTCVWHRTPTARLRPVHSRRESLRSFTNSGVYYRGSSLHNNSLTRRSRRRRGGGKLRRAVRAGAGPDGWAARRCRGEDSPCAPRAAGASRAGRVTGACDGARGGKSARTGDSARERTRYGRRVGWGGRPMARGAAGRLSAEVFVSLALWP